MSKYYQLQRLRFFITTLIIFGFNLTLLSYVIANRGDEFFIEKDSPASIGSSGSTIQNCIIEGAAAFLDSYTHTLSLLRAVEMSDITGIDQEELNSQIGQAIEGMSRARNIYNTLKLISDATPYNPYMIERLRSFDYNDFRESKGLNTAVFFQVSTYLRKGDVRGAFGKLLSGSETVLKMLKDIQAEIDGGQFPDIEKLWRINDAFSDTMRFGQYSAEVFFAAGSGR